MIKDDYVSFEQAKKLKELGFPQEQNSKKIVSSEEFDDLLKMQYEMLINKACDKLEQTLGYAQASNASWKEIVEYFRNVMSIDDVEHKDISLQGTSSNRYPSRFQNEIDEDKIKKLAYDTASESYQKYWKQPKAQSYCEGFIKGYKAKQNGL